MERRKLNAMLAVVLSTLNETGSAPEGVLYAGLMTECSMEEYQIVRNVLSSALLVRFENNVATLTSDGIAMAAKIAAHAKAVSL